MHRHTLIITATTLNAFLCPAGVTFIEWEAYGGGSAGAAGGGGGNVTGRFPLGGAGGAGSHRVKRILPVIPGTSYDAVIGAGGAVSTAAGNHNVTPQRGLAGEDTLFRINGGAVIGRASGAGPTGQPLATNSVSVNSIVVPGGTPTSQYPGDQAFETLGAQTDFFRFLMALIPGQGGAGVTNANFTRWGRDSIDAAGIGIHGTHGANSGSYNGGGGGSGGGGGPGGSGASGGPGGDANSAGTATAGTNGGNALANSGAGGGGGGGAGCGSADAGGKSSGSGGAGGSGWQSITWWA